jgi:cell division protein FtsW
MVRSSHGLVLSVLGLLIVATIMVNSASLKLRPDHSTTMEAIFLGKQTWFAVGAFLALVAGAFVPVDRLGATGKRWWTTPAVWMAAAMLVTLALVHVPGIGREVNGARRWISLGPIGLQPSEIAKWGVPIILAWYAVSQRARIHTFKWGFVVPLGAVSLLCGIIALEDLGTAVLIELVSVAMLVAAGARWGYVAAMAPLGLLAFVGLVVTSPYRMNRIMAYMDPYKDAQGKGYHVIQSMAAIAGGGLPGRGLGNGIQKFGYLPEATTDFIYAIACEELGIVGAIGILALFAMLALTGLAIATSTAKVRAADGSEHRVGLTTNFESLVALGFTLTVTLQALINVAVVTGLAPTKGIALPLISRGGTGWILTAFSLGMVAAIARASDARRRSLEMAGVAEPELDGAMPQPA